MAHDPHTEASLARHRLIGQLRASEVLGAAAVAAALTACTPAAPCRSAACPVCGLAFQQAAVAVVDEFIRRPARAIRNRMTALTIVPASGCVPPDELSVEGFLQVGAEIKAALATQGLPATVIGLEASFNEDTTGRFEPHWCKHGHGLQYDWISSGKDSALKATFPPSNLVRRTVKCESLDKRINGRLYPFKFQRIRRVTVLNTTHPERKPYRDSDRRVMRPWQAVSLAIVEHELGFNRRLLIHGIDEEAFRRHLAGLGWPRDGP